MTPNSVISHVRCSFAGCTYEQSHALDRFLDAAKALCKKNAGNEQLAQGVWLIDLKTGLPHLGQMVALAQENGIAYRTLFLEDEPDWLLFGDWS